MPTAPATLASLLDELYQKQRVLGGWTAVLSVSEESVGRLISALWPGSAQLSVEWVETGAGAVRLDLTLGPASFGLAEDSEAVTFRQAVTEATLRRGPTDVSANGITLSEDASIEGTVALQLAPVDPAQRTCVVALDIGHAKVTYRGLDGGNLPSDLGARIATALAGDESYLPLASLDLTSTPSAVLSAFKPASLQHKVTVTSSGARIFQLFIGGPGETPSNACVDVTEPVPTADGCDYSLLVDSGVVIQDIVGGFNAQTGLVKLVAVNADPAGGSEAAYAQTRNPMQFQGTISCGKAITPIQSNAAMGMNFKGSTTDGLVVSSYALPGGTISLQLAVAGNFPLQLSDTGEIKLSAASTSVTATGVAENTVKPRLQFFLNEDIGPNISNVSLSSTTDLLLRRLNLAGLQPKIDHAQIPADLVLAGTLGPAPAN